MVQLTLFPDNAPGPRWIAPRWTTASDRWLEIDSDLPDDHRARRIAQLVAALDLSPLVHSYAGLGSPAHPPELSGAAGPLRDPPRLPESGPMVRGLSVRRRGEMAGLRLATFAKLPVPVSAIGSGRTSISGTGRSSRAAKAEGWTPMKRAAMDGTFAASYASRHTPIKAQPLAQRCQQLAAAVAADFADAGRRPPEPASAAAVAPTAVDRSPRTEALPELAPMAVSTAEVAPTAEAPSPSPSPSVPASPPTPTEDPSWMATTPAGRFRQWRRYRRAQEVFRDGRSTARRR